jgi:hypothetical protein
MKQKRDGRRKEIRKQEENGKAVENKI